MPIGPAGPVVVQSMTNTDTADARATAAQVAETAARHFAGQSDLVLVAVDEERLGAGLRYEPSRGGDLFPHLYDRLLVDAVLWVKPLRLGDDGRHIMPELAA